VRVAVVGLGYWGPNIARNLVEIESAELVTVCDMRQDAVDAVRRRFPGVGATTDVEEILADDTVEAVAVVTPIATHHPLGRRVLESGKHLFVEKPLAASLAEASDLVALGRERDLVVMPGHTFLYSPSVQIVADLIASGELGEIYFVSTSRVNLGLHQSDASVVWDLAPHDFSILTHWLGTVPAHVSAMTRSCIIPGTPDVAFINLEYASGVIAHAELAWLAPSKLRQTTVVGSERMVVYNDTSNEPVRIFDAGVALRDPNTFGEYRLTYRTGDIVSPRVDVYEPLACELDDFCRAVREGTKPRSHAALGLDVLRMVEATDRSLAAGGNRVSVAAPAPAAA